MQELYDRDGKAISQAEWMHLFANLEYKRVASSRIGAYHVSTVWLGMDHGFGRSELPIIFETMVFANGNDPFNREDDMERYATEQDALAGHRQICDEIFAQYEAVGEVPICEAELP